MRSLATLAALVKFEHTLRDKSRLRQQSGLARRRLAGAMDLLEMLIRLLVAFARLLEFSLRIARCLGGLIGTQLGLLVAALGLVQTLLRQFDLPVGGLFPFVCVARLALRSDQLIASILNALLRLFQRDRRGRLGGSTRCQKQECVREKKSGHFAIALAAAGANGEERWP